MTNLSPSLFTDDMGVCAAEAMNPLGCPGLLPAWSLKMLSCLVLCWFCFVSIILKIWSLRMHCKKNMRTNSLVLIVFFSIIANTIVKSAITIFIIKSTALWLWKMLQKMTATMIMGVIITEVDSIVQRTLFSSGIRIFFIQVANRKQISDIFKNQNRT